MREENDTVRIGCSAQLRLCSSLALMDRPAFLSVRVAPEVRNRVKALAARRGLTVQDLVGDLVERFLAEQDRQPPALAAVLPGCAPMPPRCGSGALPGCGSSAPSLAVRPARTVTSTWSRRSHPRPGSP